MKSYLKRHLEFACLHRGLRVCPAHAACATLDRDLAPNPVRTNLPYGYELGRVARAIAAGRGFFFAPAHGGYGPDSLVHSRSIPILWPEFSSFGESIATCPDIIIQTLNCAFAALTIIPIYGIAQKDLRKRRRDRRGVGLGLSSHRSVLPDHVGLGYGSTRAHFFADFLGDSGHAGEARTSGLGGLRRVVGRGSSDQSFDPVPASVFSGMAGLGSAEGAASPGSSLLRRLCWYSRSAWSPGPSAIIASLANSSCCARISAWNCGSETIRTSRIQCPNGSIPMTIRKRPKNTSAWARSPTWRRRSRKPLPSCGLIRSTRSISCFADFVNNWLAFTDSPADVWSNGTLYAKAFLVLNCLLSVAHACSERCMPTARAIRKRSRSPWSC